MEKLFCDGCEKKMETPTLVVFVNGNLLMFCSENCFPAGHYTSREKARILADPENAGCKAQLLRLFGEEE